LKVHPGWAAKLPWACGGFAGLTRVMTPNAATLIRDGLALDVDERSVVANALLESIDDTDDASEVDDAWRVVVSRRLAEMRSGAVEMIDADELFAEMRASVAE